MPHPAINGYQPSLWFRNAHLNTIHRTLFHSFDLSYERRRMETTDGDFMDIDLLMKGSKKLVIAIHGLEGSSDSNYIRSLASYFSQASFDLACANLRGCSGVENRLLSAYHSGKTDDLDAIINFLQQQFDHEDIFLVGYSLGGNLILKYLGESWRSTTQIKGAATVSVPCDLKGSSEQIGKWKNKVYMERFLRSLKRKTLIKSKRFPEANIDVKAINKAKNFKQFDDLFTAPVHGFLDAEDYWRQNSANNFITDIRIPSLLITAIDDPFLSQSCIPFSQAKGHRYFRLETYQHGGHVGFNSGWKPKLKPWLETRIHQFFDSIE